LLTRTSWHALPYYWIYYLLEHKENTAKLKPATQTFCSSAVRFRMFIACESGIATIIRSVALHSARPILGALGQNGEHVVNLCVDLAQKNSFL
jgi:hypothetical protein